jgi:hypothetical protein
MQQARERMLKEIRNDKTINAYSAISLMKLRYIFILACVFIYMFLIYDTGFHGPDEPIYFAYTASLVEDGDLNAVNQLYQGGAKFVSQTYNLPDFHNHGAVVFWAPIYAYSRLFGEAKAIKCALSLSSVIFAFFTLLLTFGLCRKFFSVKTSIWSTVIMFLATPYFYFTFFEPGNGQIIASLFSVISIFVLYYASAMKRLDWLFYGTFFSICLVVKLDLWFQVFLIAMCLVVLSYRKEISLRKILYFILGFLPVFILNLVNDYFKYGNMHKGEFYLFNPHNFFFFDQLFSSYRGYFYTSPIFYVSLFGFVLITIALFKKKFLDNSGRWNLVLFFLLAMYLFIKIFIISFRYAWGGGTTGARQLLTEFPVFVLLYAYALENQRRLFRYSLCLLSLFLMVWNFMIISEFITAVDLKYLAVTPALVERLKSVAVVFNLLVHPKDAWFKLTVSGPLLCGMLLIILLALRGKRRIFSDKWIYGLMMSISIYAVSVYSLVTGLNIYHNKKNVEKLRAKGFFNQAIVLSSRDYEREENVSSMDEMINYFFLTKNLGMVEKIKRTKKDVYGDRF